MKREDVESWVADIPQNPLRPIGLFLVALIVVAALAFAGEIGKSFYKAIDRPTRGQPPHEEQVNVRLNVF